MGNKRVYNIGTSGHDFCVCCDNFKAAMEPESGETPENEKESQTFGEEPKKIKLIDLKLMNWRNRIAMKGIQWLLKACISGCLALFLLSGVTYMYNYTGVHIANPARTTDYTWESNQLKSNMTEGFARFRMDSCGFNNTEPSKKERVDILLMGSSHMEAVQIAPEDNTASRLNRLLPGLYTYNIGMSGHEIYNNVSNMSDAVSVYNPVQYVLLETGTVELEEDAMKKVIGGAFPRIPSYDSGILYLVQKKIPAVKCIYKQLEDWMAAGRNPFASNRPEDGAVISETPYDSQGYRKTLDSFLKKAVASVCEHGAKMIIFYHPTMELDSSGSLFNPTDPEALETFRETCESNGIIFVDMEKDYEQLYEREHRLPYGFINTAVGVGHLNKYGHKTVADRLAEVIRSLQ